MTTVATHGEEGMTLVEVLVVLSLIAILSASVVGGLRLVTSPGRQECTEEQVRSQIVTAQRHAIVSGEIMLIGLINGRNVENTLQQLSWVSRRRVDASDPSILLLLLPSGAAVATGTHLPTPTDGECSA